MNGIDNSELHPIFRALLIEFADTQAKVRLATEDDSEPLTHNLNVDTKNARYEQFEGDFEEDE